MDFIMVPIRYFGTFGFLSFGLSSSISSFETTGNLETSTASSCCCCFAFGSDGLEIGGTAAIFGEKLATI